MAQVKLQNVTKIYDKKKIIDNVSLTIEDKEFLVLVGSSGCGKSTLLRMIAGLENITDGKIFIDDKCVNDVHPKDRDIAFVFQNYALYPHMSVYDNIAFPLKMRKFTKQEIDKKVKEAAEILNLTDLLQRKPKQLSGGQRQALTLLMSTMEKPKLLLLDEHTAALDPKTAAKVLELTEKLVSENNLTTFMVTHNMRDALKYGNRLIMMCDGKIIFDVEGEEKKKLEVKDLLDKFNTAGGIVSDAMMLG